MKFLARLLATTLGTGYAPVAPGTAGALFILVLYFFATPVSPVIFLAVILALFFVGTWAATETEKDYGHDASQINIDEVVGMLITLFLVEKSLTSMIIGFALFRFFDIVKPFPVNKMQDLPRGWGVMMDDVIAGIFSNILLHLTMFVIGTYA